MEHSKGNVLEKIEMANGEVMVVTNEKTLTDQQKTGFAKEKKMSLGEGIRKYPWSIFWSVMVSMIIVMEGYDIILLGGLLPQAAFRERYGSYSKAHGWQISGPWQAGLNNATTCGTIFGALANGYLTQRFGYRRTILAGLLFINGSIALQAFATSLGMLAAGNFLCGLPWGIFSVLAPAYASEITPNVLRGYLANFVCFCWAAGMLVSSGVQKAFSERTDQWAYRVPYALQWAWPVPLMCILWFAPESPWILVRREKYEEAERMVLRLASKNGDVDSAATVAMMKHTVETERELEASTSYLDCFRGHNLRRTEISCVAFMCQQFDGTAITGNAVYFFTQAGIGAKAAYSLSVASLGLSCVGVVVSWYLIYHFGRRTLYLFELWTSLIGLLAVAVASTISGSQKSSYAQAGIVMCSVLIRFATSGPVCYAILAEMSSVSLRSKTISIARIAYYLSQIVCNTLQAYLINPTELNLKGKSAWVWSGTCIMLIIWAFFRLPETKDRLFEEIDLLFASKTPARKFRTTDVDLVGALNMDEDKGSVHYTEVS